MPNLAQDLATAEDELARLRGIVADTVAWIYDPAHDSASRCALARRLGLPEPTMRPPKRHAPAALSTTEEVPAGLHAVSGPAGTGETMGQVLEPKEK